jgi:hypothetical protein
MLAGTTRRGEPCQPALSRISRAMASLQLLTEIGAICDLNRGAVIDTSNPRHLEIYLIKDSMREDSKTFGLAIFLELEFFVAKMADGVRH